MAPLSCLGKQSKERKGRASLMKRGFFHGVILAKTTNQGATMKKIASIALAGAVLALAGCKSGIHVPVSYSSATGANKIVKAELYVEVPSCKDSKTGLESSHLLEAKQKVAYVIKGAEYSKCERKGFVSLAHFNVPVTVGSDPAASKTELMVTLSERNAIYFMASNEVKKKIAQVSEGTIGFDPKDFAITLWFKNDSKGAFDVWVPSAIVRDEAGGSTPVHSASFKMKKGDTYGFELSNVAALQIFDRPNMAEAFSLVAEEK